jgi:hypothetical protein
MTATAARLSLSRLRLDGADDDRLAAPRRLAHRAPADRVGRRDAVRLVGARRGVARRVGVLERRARRAEQGDAAAHPALEDEHDLRQPRRPRP